MTKNLFALIVCREDCFHSCENLKSLNKTLKLESLVIHKF